MSTIQCLQCGVETKVRPARLGVAKFCSRKCTDEWRKSNFTGAANPNFRGGLDRRTCGHCGSEFECRKASSIKFCSKPCADKGGFRYEGEQHPNYRPTSRRRSQRGKHGAWARAVISRDQATCQHCGATEGLHAHHIKPFETHPELRWELDNGLTLCGPCHWKVHSTALIANGVNSGNLLPGNAGDNPEPSFGRKPVEGVTTNGRAYRRWNGECGTCGTFVSKSWSEAKGKANLFCSRSCASKWRVSQGIAFRGYRAHGGNSDTSALPETDDIV